MSPALRAALPTLALCGGLLLLERAHPSVAPSFVPRWLQLQVRDLVYHGASEEEELGLLADYYAELLDASREATHAGTVDEAWERALHRAELLEQRKSFLLYHPRPSAPDPADPSAPPLVSSAGLFDGEYPEERRPGVRRVLWIGDSLSRGLGAPRGLALEPRVEAWLNEGRGATPAVEVLNLAVEGYRLSQFVKVVELALPRWRPDVVLLGLSDLSVSRIWGHHVARLAHEGIDLEYPFLRELIVRARLDRDDSPRVTDGKLARFRAEFVRWALSTIDSMARGAGASTLVVLIPAVGESARLQARFAESRTLLEELRLPTLDLVDAFAGLDDLTPWRVSDVDHHPNAQGYRLLFERFAAGVEADPALAALLRGPPAPGR